MLIVTYYITFTFPIRIYIYSEAVAKKTENDFWELLFCRTRYTLLRISV